MKKTQSRIVASMLAIVMLISTAFVPASAAKVTVKKVSVASSLSGDKKTVVVAKGKSVKLKTTVTVKPNKKANKKVSYSVKNKSIATVDSKGVVKGKKAGTTKVTVTSSKNKKKKATITVKVMAGAVTSVKLDKKKASLNAGQTLKLKTTVKAAKGASKTIAYTTSKAKVAKVNEKGVITAVGPGTATITAKAIDGSGKKATCKVTVANSVNPINLAGMNLPNERTVNFALDKACALTPGQVSIAKKVFSSGTYNNQLIINNMTTADNVNYTVVLADDTSISVGDFVQVSVPSLTGTVKSLELEYKEAACAFTGESVSSWKVGTYGTTTFSFGDGYGYSSYALSGLPAGLTYEIKNGEVKVKGTPTTAGRFDYVLSATDELGNTLSRTIHFIIGSDTVIVGAANTVYKLIGTDSATSYVSPRVTGGSGSYKYSVIADPQGTSASIDEDDDVRIRTAVAGTYTVVVRATDTVDASRYCDINVVVNVKQGVVVGGCLKDAQGNPMNDGRIYFTNKDRASLYLTDNSYWIGSSGTYSVTLEPGVYDIRATYSGGDIEASESTTYLYSQSLVASQTGYDIQLKDLYKVVLVNGADNSDSLSRTWYMNHESVGSGSSLYLKPGAYAIESGETGSSSGTVTGDWFNGQTTTYTPYKLAASFTVVNTAVQAAVSKVAISSAVKTETKPAAKDTTYAVSLGDSKYFSSASPYYAYKFIATETGKYEINTSYSNVSIYDMNGNLMPDANDVYELTAGTTYIIGRGDYDVYGSFTITKVTEPAPATE